ncbi:hypothetical protein P3L10_029828 [Capsicum annuum]
MKDEYIDRLFKKSCFGCFLDLRRIKSTGENKKMDKIWINYCGMPVCFGLQEFDIVTGLRYHHPKEPPIAKGRPRKRSKVRKRMEKINELFDIARRVYKALDLLTDLMDKTIPKQYKEQLCLAWFAHLVILARDVNKVMEDDLLARAKDFDKFNNYPGDMITST